MTERGRGWKVTLQAIREVLFWCSIINLALLLGWFVVFTAAHDWIYRVHGKWFDISRDRFDAIHYAGMALYKIGILLFNLVPFIVLLIVD